jgi:hypothetical protein
MYNCVEDRRELRCQYLDRVVSEVLACQKGDPLKHPTHLRLEFTHGGLERSDRHLDEADLFE